MGSIDKLMEERKNATGKITVEFIRDDDKGTTKMDCDINCRGTEVDHLIKSLIKDKAKKMGLSLPVYLMHITKELFEEDKRDGS